MNTEEFFDTEDFAVLAAANGRTFNAIFDAQYVDALGVGTVSPAATCDSAVVADLERDDEMEIGGVVYRVVGIEPDGTGVTVLRLHRA